MTRELVVLGCASQVPTRYRNHNGYFLRWDGEGILFDPGEGTQRQMVFAGVSASSITRICITHFHGDHCFGLPGVLARIALDGPPRPIDVYYPAGGEPYLDRLRHAAVTDHEPDLRLHPVQGAGVVEEGSMRIIAHPLRHRTETFGWRIEEPDGRRMLADRLEAYGVAGPDVGRLQREGTVEIAGRTVRLEEVSEPRPGQKVAFVMDTAICEGARALAEGVDLLICESTYLSAEAELAERYQHLTAAQAATLARDAGARRLVLTHYSSRYKEQEVFVPEASVIFPEVSVVHDLDVIAVSGSPTRSAVTQPPPSS